MKILFIAAIALYGLPLFAAEPTLVAVWKSAPGNNSDVNADTPICFGIIVGPKQVLTTVSCVNQGDSFKVSHLNETEDSTKRYTATSIEHPHYSPSHKLNNVALLMLASDMFSANDTTGIASTTPGLTDQCEHHFAVEPRPWTQGDMSVNISQCTTQNTGFICATYSDMAANICAGNAIDEGEALVCSGQLTGIYAKASGCASKMAAYTDLPTVKSWIDNDGKSASVKTTVTWLLVLTSLLAAVHL